MPVINSISNMKNEMQKWRQDLHTFPELGFEEKKTSDFIAEKLKEFGIEFYRDIAKTGIVGVIHGSKPGSEIIIPISVSLFKPSLSIPSVSGSM